jgi:hypothetical protein
MLPSFSFRPLLHPAAAKQSKANQGDLAKAKQKHQIAV